MNRHNFLLPRKLLEIPAWAQDNNIYWDFASSNCFLLCMLSSVFGECFSQICNILLFRPRLMMKKKNFSTFLVSVCLIMEAVRNWKKIQKSILDQNDHFFRLCILFFVIKFLSNIYFCKFTVRGRLICIYWFLNLNSVLT